MFDISQTEGEELPSLSAITGSSETDLLFLENVYCTLNIKLETRPLPDGIRGVSLGGHVVVKDGFDTSMRFRVLAHELCHELLHREIGADEVSRNRTLIETEAEAVAFVVCRACGVETRALSSEYIHLHRGDDKLLMGSFVRLQKTATYIIDLIETDKQTPVPVRVTCC